MATQSLYLTSTDTAAIAVFNNHDSADIAVKQLASSGFDITRVTVIGRGSYTEEKVTGFYTDSLLFGGVFLPTPGFGSVFVAGHLAAMVIAAIEGSIAIGGRGAIGAALYSVGIRNDGTVRFGKAVKADAFLVMVHGTANEVHRARAVLQRTRPEMFDVHGNIDMHPHPATLVASH